MRKISQKEKPRGSWEVHNGQVRYHCSQCNTHEDIPADVVNFFDVMDRGILPSHLAFAARTAEELCYRFKFAQRALCSRSKLIPMESVYRFLWVFRGVASTWKYWVLYIRCPSSAMIGQMEEKFSLHI